MASELDQFIASIVAQESGGDYNAVGAQTRYGRAYGKYQILETNIRAWGKEAGYPNLTLEQFRRSPAIQDKVARTKLASYYKQYGAAGAASAWYSGSAKNVNSTKPQAGGAPSVKQYVQSVLGRMGTAQPAAPRQGTVTAGTGTPGSQTVSREDAIASYGYIAELARSVPDVKRALDKALADGWTAERFTAEIQKTKWWRTTSETQRQIQVLQSSDPAEYRKQLAKRRNAIKILARQFGVPLNTQQLDTVSAKALSQGWSDAEMQRYVVAETKVKGGKAAGQTGVTVAALKEQAADYYVPLSDAVLNRWTKQILNGDVPAESFKQYLVEQASSLFPQIASSLQQGVTARDYFEPYQQAAAELLEMPLEAVDFSNSRYRNAVFGVDPTTGAKTVKNLSQYKQYLRSQPAWAKTAAARDAAATFGNQLLEQFGKVAY